MKRWQKIASSPEELLKWRLGNTCNYCTKNINNICQEEYKPGTNQIDCKPGILEYLNQEIEDEWNIKTNIIKIPDAPCINISISHEEIKDVNDLFQAKQENINMKMDDLAKTLHGSTFKLNKDALNEAIKISPNNKNLIQNTILKLLDGYSYNDIKAILKEVLEDIGNNSIFSYDSFFKHIDSKSNSKEE